MLSLQNKRNAKARDQYIKDHADLDSEYIGGIKRFNGLHIKDVEYLMDVIGAADPDDRQNEAPSIQELVDFASNYADDYDITFRGYVVSPDREDYRMSIDGIRIYSDTDIAAQDHDDFMDLVHDHFADDVTSAPNVFDAWWD